jgi:peptide/nickel transport system substrate-binding protein
MWPVILLKTKTKGGGKMKRATKEQRRKTQLLLMFTVVTIGVVAMFCGTWITPAGAADRFLIATPIEPDTMDISKTRLTPMTKPILTNINEPLVDVDTKGNPKPGIASWRVLDKDRTIEFKLKQGVKFHTGDPLTSADIRFSHDRSFNMSAYYKRKMLDLDRIETPDATTIRFVFKQPNPNFLRERSLQIHSKAYFDRVGEEEFSTKPVGTGPYKFAGYKFGEYLDLDAFEGFWGGSPEIKKVRIEFIKDDETRVAKLRSGEADLIMHTPYGMVKQLNAEGFKTTSVPVHPTPSILFPMLNPNTPWADVRVRKAIAMAIDADAIIKGPMHGIPERHVCMGPDELGYDPSLKLPPYNLTAARALLKEAGYEKGFDMPMYYMTGAYTGMKETAEAILLALRPIGINVQLQGLEQLKATKTLGDLHTDKNAKMVAFHPIPLVGTPEPAESVRMVFGTTMAQSPYTNTAIDEPLNTACITMDDKERGRLVRKAAKILVDDVAYIPMWSSRSVYAMKPTVTYIGIPRTSAGAWIRIKDIHLKR